MPAKWFICPDSEQILITDCLEEGGCRRSNRCATRSYLKLVSRERVWTGKPSTTQCITGTMLSYLRLVKDFAIDPGDRAFMILGTKAHKALEIDDDYSLMEERFDGEDTLVTGIMDVLEVENGKSVLVDHKTSGSYKVMKALGWYTELEETGVVYKSGPRKGEMRTRKVLKQDDSMIDRWEWELQLNKYRMEIEKRGFPVDEMRIQCIVRDGNTFIARGRGVVRNVYYFRINKIPDEEIISYFNKKRIALLYALKYGWSRPCSEAENWGGIRCGRYCEVAQYCPYGKYLKEERKEIAMPINGVSERRWMPRDGWIRLGIKKKNQAGKEFPAEVEYFVLDPSTPNEDQRKELLRKFHLLYGDKPTSIEIMIPSGDKLPDGDWVVFPQNYARYGKGSGLKCKGNGVTATCMSEEFAEGLEVSGTEGGLPVVKCLGKDCIYQTQKKECNRHAVLNVFLPRLPGAGVWQISTTSWCSIVNINSDLDHLNNLIGRFHMLYRQADDFYLRLMRIPTQIVHENKTRTHWPLKIDLGIALADLTRLASLEAGEVMAALPASEVEDITYDDVPEATIHEPPQRSAELPSAKESESEANGETYQTIVAGMAMQLGSDAVVFGKFVDLTFPNLTEGKKMLKLKEASGDNEAMKALSQQFTEWTDTLADNEATDNGNGGHDILQEQIGQIKELVGRTAMKTLGTADFRSWREGVADVPKDSKMDSLTEAQGDLLIAELKKLTGDDNQDVMEF